MFSISWRHVSSVKACEIVFREEAKTSLDLSELYASLHLFLMIPFDVDGFVIGKGRDKGLQVI